MPRWRSRRFWFVYAATLLLGSAWPICAVASAGPLPDALTWIAHSATWGFFGVFIMPIAAALFASGLDSEIILLRKWSGAYQFWLGAALPLFFIALASGIGKNDADRPGTLPVYLGDKASRIRAYDIAKSLRKASMARRDASSGADYRAALRCLLVGGLRDAETQRRVKEYEGLIKADRPLPFRKANLLALVSIALNAALVAVAVFLAWYLFAMGYTKVVHGYSSPGFNRVLLAFACFGLWFPCRVYASWWAEHLYKQHVFADYQAFFALGAAFAIATIVLALLRFNDSAAGAKVISLGLFFAPLVTAGIGLLSPQRLVDAARAIEPLTPIHVAAIGSIVALLLGMIVCAVTIDVVPNGGSRARSDLK